VIRTRVGYTGGSTESPTYHSLGDHTETVQLDFDPAVLSYERLLEAFFAAHDPTYASPKRQYMSAVFFHDMEQEKAARQAMSRVEVATGRRVKTLLLPLARFYLAEDYHQKYYLQGDALLAGELRAFYPEFADFVDSTAATRINAYLYGCGTPAQVKADLARLGLSEKGTARLARLTLE
jgi:peptide-methionine (S)-S-oxide reductase